MGYTITIGQKRIDDDGTVYAETVQDDNAPAFGEPTDYLNERWPSYGSWHNALKACGVYSMFFNDPGHLIGGHPGYVDVTYVMREKLNAARADLLTKDPSIKAEYNTGRDIDGYYCRLVWLCWWVDWALENCEEPVIVNT